jgi:class 3 adenylate cyclase
MKRLTYVSKLNAVLDQEEILEIGRISSINNKKRDVTGVLISVRDYFFQVLEGECTIVDELVEKIARDPRHHEITILSAETGCEERLFTDWGMKTVALSESNDLMLLAIGMMLQNIAQSYSMVGRYTQPVLLKYLMEGINPLTIPIKSTEKIIVSGSMTDFSVLSKDFGLEEVVKALNDYLEICSTSFIEYGGQIAKYSSGCIVAHFLPNQVDVAIAACLDAYKRLKLLVDQSPIYSVISCGFGLTLDSMIEGNIGSSIKMDYTVLGGAVDQSVNLGVFARDLYKPLAVNESIYLSADDSWGFSALGEFSFKEQNELVQVYVLTEI